MCFPSLSFFSALLPYCLLFLMPIYGSFFGSDPVLRFSIFIYLQNILSRLISRFTVFSEPLVQFGLLLVCFSVPSASMPYSVVWLYDKALWMSEPVWQVTEAVGVLRLAVCISKEAEDRIWDQPVLAKGFILITSLACHVVAGALAWTMFSTGSQYYTWALIILLVLSVAVHCMTFINDDGIILDAAVVHMCSIVFLYGLYTDQLSTESVLKIPDKWQKLGDDSSYMKMLSIILTSGVAGAGHVVQFVQRLLDPWFFCSGLIRLCSILYTITIIRQYITDNQEEEDPYKVELADEGDAPDESSSHWNSPLIIRLVIIFIYTQFLVYHVQRPLVAGGGEVMDWVLWLVPSCRWVQIATLNALYIYKLAYVDEDDV